LGAALSQSVRQLPSTQNQGIRELMKMKSLLLHYQVLKQQPQAQSLLELSYLFG
jgi:hypothetical protein